MVGTGEGNVRPINVAKEGKPLDKAGNLLPPVNEGAYRGFTHILALGVTVTFDELFGAARPFHYGNAYERGYVGEGDTSDKRDKRDKRDEKADKPSADDSPRNDPTKDPEKAA